MLANFQIDIKKVICYLLKNKYIYIKYTNGTGNNLFQYYFCFLLVKDKNIKIINKFSIYRNMYNLTNRILSLILCKFYFILGSNNPVISIINNKTKQVPNSFINIFVDTGEVVEVFQDKDKLIKEDFISTTNIKLKNTKNKNKKIVLHLRLGDRLFRKSDYKLYMNYDFGKLQVLLNKETNNFTKKNFEIIAVTDSPKIMFVKNELDFNIIDSHTSVNQKDLIDRKTCLSYIKKIQDFIIFNNIKIKGSHNLYEDFDLMLNADTLIFLHGTLSWWAGYLGNQRKVYVSAKWRPVKERNSLLSRYKSNRWEKW